MGVFDLMGIDPGLLVLDTTVVNSSIRALDLMGNFDIMGSNAGLTPFPLYREQTVIQYQILL